MGMRVLVEILSPKTARNKNKENCAAIHSYKATYIQTIKAHIVLCVPGILI